MFTINSAIGFKDVELGDKPVFDRFFQATGHNNSECTFTYYYMWRKAGRIKWAIVEGCLCILLDFFGKPFFFPPYGATRENFRAVIDKMKAHLAASGYPFYMRAVTKPFLALFRAAAPGRFSFTLSRDSADYIYRGDDLRELRGRKYDGKRNHINAFLRAHPDFRYLPVTRDNLSECLNFLDCWFQKRPPSTYLAKEREAICEIMHNLEALGVKGAVIEISGRIEALTLGEAINSATAVIHAEKANEEIRGLYQVINREFCRREWAGMAFINREEDMGVAGLRQAKLSYFPCALLEKYEVTETGGAA